MSKKQAKTSREVATDRARVFPSTYKRIQIRAVQEGVAVGELIDKMEKFYTKQIPMPQK